MAKRTITLEKEEREWVVLALETVSDMVAAGLHQRGEDFKEDEAFKSYSALLVKFKALDK
jgi:hypothetical protein